MMRRPGRLVLLGHPVAHSLSPRMHRAALQAAGIDASYDAIDVPPERLAWAVHELRAGGAAGNVTIPHKEAMCSLCDRLTPLAQRVGAVNTFWVESGSLTGDNTDVAGVERAVRALLDAPPRSLRIALLGAGGAAAAVLAAAERWPGCEVRVWNRTAARARRLCARFASVAHPVESGAEAADGADLVVNATAIGMTGGEPPVDPAQLGAHAAVLDLVYRAGGTALVRAARARGLRAGDGLAMLVEQGAAAFSRWFGVEPDRSAMWNAVRS